MTQSKPEDIFLKLINPTKTQIKSKLPFIWVFGSGGDEVLNIEQITHPFNPSHKDFIAYNNVNSYRAKFIQWSKCSGHYISEHLVVPEFYPEWLNFKKYSNLVDFELDISSISQGVIIFSEGIGAYTEIGMFSCFNELHKNILILSQEKYINDNKASFFNYGAIFKINENKISEELNNIWALDNNTSHYSIETWNNLFTEISDHFLNIITDQNNGKVKFNHNNKHHIILLCLDLIDLFPNQTKSFYKKILKSFDVECDNESINKIIIILELLDLITPKKSGNNTYYSLKRDYDSCLDYQANSPNRFERSEFKLMMRL